MADQFCRQNLHEIRQLAGSHRTTLVSLCVLNFVFAVVATFGNILAIQALQKTSFLPANLRKFLLSLASTDLAVGLLGEPSLALLQGMALNENYNLNVLCPVTLTFCYAIIHLLAIASFFNVTAIAVDRLLAVSLHLRYDELVTSRRVTISLVAIWLTSCVSTRIIVTTVKFFFLVAIGSTGFMLATVANFRVYKVARYHWNQIQNQFQQQNLQALALHRKRKSALSVLYIYFVFVACYLPFACCMLLRTTGYRRVSVLIANEVTFFFVQLNSSLNPLVYCWRYPEVRHIMKSTLKKIVHVSEE